MLEVDEMLMWLHRQIDPKDRLNPKYDHLHKQIQAIQDAKSAILAAQPVRLVITRSQYKALSSPPNPEGNDTPITRLRDCWSCGTGMDYDQHLKVCDACGAENPNGDGSPSAKGAEQP